MTGPPPFHFDGSRSSEGGPIMSMLLKKLVLALALAITVTSAQAQPLWEWVEAENGAVYFAKRSRTSTVGLSGEAPRTLSQ